MLVMPRIVSDPLFAALEDAGISDANTRRVVIDIRYGHVPVVHIERWGDDKLLSVVQTLGGVQITRDELPAEPA